MEALDSDDALLRSYTGKVAQRDCVQFVPLREFSGVASGAGESE